MAEQLRTGPGFAVLRSPDGRLIDAELADADALVGAGYSYASREAAATENERRRLAEQTGQAALERGVRGVTFGLVEGVDPTEDTETTRRRAQVFAEEHPIAEGAVGFGAELAVDLAVGAATGGFGTGATRAARLARVASGAASDAAAALTAERELAFQQSREADVGAAMAFGVGAGALGRGVVAGAGRLLRGGEVVEQAAREQAEDAAAHMRRTGEPAPDAPTGAATPDGPPPDAPAAGAAAAPDSPTPVGAERFDQTAPDVGVSAFERARAQASELNARQVATAAERGQFDDPAWVMAQARHTDAVLEQQGSRMGKAMNELDDAIDDTIGIENKPGIAAALVATDEVSRRKQLEFANKTGQEYTKFIKQLEREAKASAVKGLETATKQLDTIARKALKKMASKKAGDRAIGADGFKRAMQKLYVKVSRAQLKHIDPMVFDGFKKRLDAFEKGRRFALEDESIWGKFAEYQAETNDWWHTKYLPNVWLTSRELVQQVGQDYDAKGAFVWDVRKLTGFLKNGRQDGDEIWHQLDRQLSARDDLADIARKYNLGQGGGAEADRMRRQLREVRGAIAAAENNREARRIAALIEPEQTGFERALSGLRQYGGSLGGILAASAQAASDATRSIAGASRRSAARVAGKAPRVPPGARRATTRALAAVSAIELLRGDQPSVESGYSDVMARMREFRANPLAFGDAMATAYPGLSAANPELHAALTQRVASAMAYLLANAPPAVGLDAANPGGIAPSRYDLERFAELYAAALHPETVYVALEAGLATPRQLATLEAVHPELYTQLELDVADAAAANAAGMTGEQRAQLAALFPHLAGLGGQIYGPAGAGLMAAPPPPAPPSAAPRPSETITSGSAALSSGPTLAA